MKKLAAIMMGLALLLTSCSKTDEKPAVLSVDIWVGASPIYYAQAAGWLDEANIKVLVAPSITENLKNFTSKAADMVTGTNREYKVLKAKNPDLATVIIYDRSYGGDVIMANRSIDELKGASTIGVYLEKDTVGEEMWNYFEQYEEISKGQYTIFGRFQDELSRMRSDEITPPQVIVTYNPHNLPLLKNGFHQVASSKDERYLIVDGIYTTKAFAAAHKEQIEHLHEALNKAVAVYRKDPKGFYEKVKTTMGNPSYEEFQDMAKNIEWVLPQPSEKMLKQLEASGYSTKDLSR